MFAALRRALPAGLPLFWLLLAPSFSLAADKAGSADYPGIGRFEGSEITKYSVANFDETTLATGSVLKKSDAEKGDSKESGK